jgi:ribosomal 50S subunit-recycling heat shock protein
LPDKKALPDETTGASAEADAAADDESLARESEQIEATEQLEEAEPVEPELRPLEQFNGLRLDKWLWHARFFKTRALAGALCDAGRLRLNRLVVRKAHQLVRPGDVLTFPQGRLIRVVRVKALGARREGASAARLLYEDLEAPGGG